MKITKSTLSFTVVFSLLLFPCIVKSECIEPYENIIIDSDTVLCQGTYNINDTDMNGAIIINSSDLVLDCNGSTIVGERIGGSTGIANGYYDKVKWILTSGYDNVTVKNCNIENHYIGIFWVNASGGTIENNAVTNSVRNGIEVDHSDDNILSNNKVDYTYGWAKIGPVTSYAFAGIELRSSNFSILINNSADFNPHGIMVDNSEHVTLEENSAQNNENGLVAVFSEHITMNNNSAQNNYYIGFAVGESLYVDILENQANGNLLSIGVQANHSNIADNKVTNTYGGIGMMSGTLNTSLVGATIKNITEEFNITHNPHIPDYCYNMSIINNTVNQSYVMPGYYPSGFGITLEECANTFTSGNEIDGSELTGIVALGSSNNVITENSLSNNDGYGGIFLTTDNNNTVEENIIFENEYGIYAKDSLKNLILFNNISGNIYDGIRIDNSNTTHIQFNNITFNDIGIQVTDTSEFYITGNLLDNNLECDIIIDPSTDFEIRENGIYRSNYGIWISEGGNANISENIIKLNSVGALIKDSYEVNIIGNIFSNNTESNIIIDPSSEFSLIDNLIYYSEYGLKILNSVAGSLLRNIFEFNAYAIYLNSSDVIAKDSAISGSTHLDVWAEDSNSAIINTSFDSAKTNITGPSPFSVIWYLDIRVLDQNQNPAEGALVTGYDNNNEVAFNFTTNSSGHIPIQELTEYIENSAGRICLSPYVVQAEKQDYVTEILVFELNESTSLEIILSSSMHESNIDVDPDTINLKNKGKFIMAFIEVPGYNVSSIDIDTVRMNESIPAINDTKYGFVKDPTIEDRDDDGLLEYMAVFYRGLVRPILQAGENTLTITGEIEDTNFEGSDNVVAIN